VKKFSKHFHDRDAESVRSDSNVSLSEGGAFEEQFLASLLGSPVCHAVAKVESCRVAAFA